MSSKSTMNPKLYALLGALVLMLVVVGATPGLAVAADVFVLDTSPASGAFAPVAVDSAGTGYFAWKHTPPGGAPDVTMFCKVARGGACAGNSIVLTTPPVGFGGATQVDAAFPVLGSGQTVYVVGPRFIAQDVVVWTSTDGGVTFGPATQVAQTHAYLGNTNPTDVLAAPLGGFYVSSHNPGSSFISVPSSGTGPAASADLTPAGGTSNAIGDSTLGLAGGGATGNPVVAWSMFSSGQPFTINYTRYTGGVSGTGDPNNAASWAAPSQVTTGKLSSLAGGPSGLFLASEDIDAAGHYTQVNVRKYTPGAGFGTPVKTLQSDTSYDNTGRIFQTPGGRLLVAWQGPTRADGGVAIRLFGSTDGGTTFSSLGDVAQGTPHYAIADARVAAADDGQGFVSFIDYGGGNRYLRVADFQGITGIATTLATSGQQAAPKLTVGPNTGVTDTATIQSSTGTVTRATGTVRYQVYSDANCKKLANSVGSDVVIGGKSTSNSISLPVGTWYFQAGYSGDASNQASGSACGDEVLTVAPASANVAGIIFVGGKIIINASFNTRGRVLVTSHVSNASTLIASAAKKGCKTGQVPLKVGNRKGCVSDSFGTITVSIPAAGAYRIKLPPSGAALKALNKGKTLHVRVTLTFKPAAGGKPVVRTLKITIKGKKKK